LNNHLSTCCGLPKS